MPGIRQPGDPVGLKLTAAAAKRAGKTYIRDFVNLHVQNEIEPVEESFKRDSYLVAKLVKFNQSQWVTRSYIFTIHRFKIDRVLQARPPASPCDTTTRRSDLASDEFELGLLGGTAVVDGVTIEQDSADGLISLSEGLDEETWLQMSSIWAFLEERLSSMA